MRVLVGLSILLLTIGCPAEPPPPPPTPKATPKRAEDHPTYCVFRLRGADFEGEEIALVPSGGRADEEFWLYDADQDVTRLGFVGTWRSWTVKVSLSVSGARATGSYHLGEDEPGRGYHLGCELSFHDPKVPRDERPLLYLTEGNLVFTEQAGDWLEGTLRGTFASRRHSSLTDTPAAEWVTAELTEGRFRARFDDSQTGAARWPHDR